MRRKFNLTGPPTCVHIARRPPAHSTHPTPIVTYPAVLEPCGQWRIRRRVSRFTLTVDCRSKNRKTKLWRRRWRLIYSPLRNTKVRRRGGSTIHRRPAATSPRSTSSRRTFTRRPTWTSTRSRSATVASSPVTNRNRRRRVKVKHRSRRRSSSTPATPWGSTSPIQNRVSGRVAGKSASSVIYTYRPSQSNLVYE